MEDDSNLSEGQYRASSAANAETPDESKEPGGQSLPPLSREALQRIEQAEEEAKERYDRDKWPYFPTNPEFFFLAESVFRAMDWIQQYLRVYAEEVLDAHLREYLAVSPFDLLTNAALARTAGHTIFNLTNTLWYGYKATLRVTPFAGQVRYMKAVMEGTLDEHPDLTTHHYPDAKTWADEWNHMEPQMKRFDAQWFTTIQKVLQVGFKRFRTEAASKLGISLDMLQPAGSSESTARISENGAGGRVADRTEAPSDANIERRKARTRKRRNERYKAIDAALRKIAESMPRGQGEIFEMLDNRRIPIPAAEPFLSARGWMTGFRRKPGGARAWLSKRWAELELARLPSGPKKKSLE